MNNIRYSIESEDKRICYYITDYSDELKSINLSDKKLNSNDKYIDCYDIYDDSLTTHEKLKLFKKDFTIWTEEIKALHDKDNYDYFDAKQYHNNNVLVMCFFKKYSAKILNKLKLDDIDKIESSYIEATSNGGLSYLNSKGIHKCNGYDYNGYFSNILGNPELEFKFPIKKGKQIKYTIEEIKELYKKRKLNFGYYEIKISSEHKDISKVFSFSPNNTYNYYSLCFCLQYHSLYKIKLEMVDKDYNAYIYDEKNVINSSEIFGTWFNKINDMKSKLPKNKIIKSISSSLWGNLIQFNRMYLSLDEIMERDDISRNITDEKRYLISKHNSDTSIEIIDKYQMYKNGGIARIKSFIAAFNRDYLARTIIKEKIHDKIIRIHTDGIVLSEPHTFSGNYFPIVETKTTGNLFFVSKNEYYNQCCKCNNFYHYKKYKTCPDCD